MILKQKEPIGKNVIIGVFITKKHAQDLIAMHPQFVKSHRYIRYIELAKANQDLDVTLYFFTTDDVSFEKKCVMGIYYNREDSIWQRTKFPLPYVLYDRGGGSSKYSQPVIKKFWELNIRNINARHYFDKWDLYARLSKLDTIAPHLPVTVKGAFL